MLFDQAFSSTLSCLLFIRLLIKLRAMRYTIIITACLLASVHSSAQSTAVQKTSPRQELTYSGVIIKNILSPQQKENLFALGRTWGFLKYYHPDVAKGSYDFDSCLFSILPSVMYAENKLKRDELLFNWMITLGDENKYPEVPPVSDTDIVTKAKLEWLHDKTIFSEKLSK